VRVAVLASGGGSNLQALLDRFAGSESGVEVALVVASRPGIGALVRAERAGVEARVIDPRALGEGFAAALLAALEEAGVGIVVLAGWLQRVPAAVVRRWHGRMLNVHPALLPAFGGQGMYGARVHRAVLEAGVRVTGVTVHLVDEAYDEGAIVAQWPVPVLDGDTPESLAARVLAVEHRVLPLAVEALAGKAAAPDRAFDAFASSASPPPEAALRSLTRIR
jgi:phosphoribosylglycinamide formyltransferase 1